MKKHIIIIALFAVLFFLVTMGINWLDQKELIKNVELCRDIWLFCSICLCITVIRMEDQKDK